MADAAIDFGVGDHMSREAYRQWAEVQPGGRFERIEGVVVSMAPKRLSHANCKAMVWLALHRAISEAGLPCQVYPDGVAVEADDNDFEPDALVRCGDPLPGDGVAVPDPVIVVEVLSPSTRQVDLTRKLVGYFQVPSVRHYLIFWADRAQVIHHRRRPDDEGIETLIVTTGEIRLDPPGLGIMVEAVYAR